MALNKITAISASAVIALLMATSVSAHSGKNVAAGHKDGIVKDSWGNCILSVSGNDLCSPAPEPAKCEDVKTCRTVAAPVTMRKTLSGDTNFKFDHADLTAAGAAELTAFVGSLRGVNVTSINVAGHTDAVGSESYNLGLSKRRAKTVADFLVANGANGAKISAAGFGESQATQPSSASNAARMADRRVDVTVQGSTTGRGAGKEVCETKKVCADSAAK